VSVRDGLTETIYSDTNSTVGIMQQITTQSIIGVDLDSIVVGCPPRYAPYTQKQGGSADVTVSNLMVFNSALNAVDVQSWVTYVNNGYT